MGFKASKCNNLMNLTVSRIKILRNKRGVVANQTRKDVAQLLQAGQEKNARSRVELVIREENLLAAYDLIEKYCELLVSRLSTINSQKFCPADLKEAVSSLIFAAPRCADLQEIPQIRDMFTAKYGKEFAVAAAELHPDCGVSRKIIEKLASHPPTGEMKLKLMQEIAIEHKIDWESEKSISKPLKLPENSLDGPRRVTSTNDVLAAQVPMMSTSPKMDALAAESKINVGIVSSAQSSSRDTLLAHKKGDDSKGYFNAEYNGRSAQVSAVDPYARAMKEGKMDYKNISVENTVVRDQDVLHDEGTVAQVLSESSSKIGEPASVQSRKSREAIFPPSANSKFSSLGKYNWPPREELHAQQKGDETEYDGRSAQVGPDPYTRARMEGKMDYSTSAVSAVVKDEDVLHDESTAAAHVWSESALKTKKPTSVQSRQRSEADFVPSSSLSSIGDSDALPAKEKFSLRKYRSPEKKGLDSKTYFKTEDDDPYTRARKEGKMDYKNISVAHVVMTNEDAVFDEGNPATQVWSESASKKEKPTSMPSKNSSEVDRNSKRGTKTEYKDAASAAQAAFESAAIATAAAQAAIDLSAKRQSKMSSSEKEEQSSINQSSILKKEHGSVRSAARRVDSQNYVRSDARGISETGDASASVFRVGQLAMQNQSLSHFSRAAHQAKSSSESEDEFVQTSSQETQDDFGFHGRPLFDDYDGIEVSNEGIAALRGRNLMKKEENANLFRNNLFSSRSTQSNMLSRKDEHHAFNEEGSGNVEGLSSGSKQRTQTKWTSGNDLFVERFNDYDGRMDNNMGNEEKSILARSNLFFSESKHPDILSSQEKFSPYIEESSESAKMGLRKKLRESRKTTGISVESFNDYDGTEASTGRIPSWGRTDLEIQENASSYRNNLFNSRPKQPSILPMQEISSSFVEEDSDGADEFDSGRKSRTRTTGKDFSVERVGNYDGSESNTGRMTLLRGRTRVGKEDNASSSRNNLFSSTLKQPNRMSVQEKFIPFIEEDSDSAEEFESSRISRTRTKETVRNGASVERLNNYDGDNANNVSHIEKEKNVHLPTNNHFRQEMSRPFIEEGSDSAQELGLGRNLRTRAKPIVGTDASIESHAFESQSYLRKPQIDLYVDNENEQKRFQSNHKTVIQLDNGRQNTSDDDRHVSDAIDADLRDRAQFPVDKGTSYKPAVVNSAKLKWRSTDGEELDLSLNSREVQPQKCNDFLSIKSKVQNDDENWGFHRGQTDQVDTKQVFTEISWKDGTDSSYTLESNRHNGERQRSVRSVRTKQSRKPPSSSRFEPENGAEDESTSNLIDPQRMERSAKVTLESTSQTSSSHLSERLSPESKPSQADSFKVKSIYEQTAFSNITEYDDIAARFEALRRKR